MFVAKSHSDSFSTFIAGKLTDYLQLVKLRLTSLVVFSAVMGYLLGIHGVFNIAELLMLVAGGFAVTGASNALNQIFERDYDRQMERTAHRPLPKERITVMEAGVVAVLLGIVGVSALYFLHPLCAFLGAFALVAYAFVYTPLKRISSVAVFAGAVPGAVPVVIGWTAATHAIGIGGLLLFAIQFIWQFPHTWSIAWLLNKDYKKAGFKMLPSGKGPGKSAAFQIFMYTLLLIPVSLLPAKFGVTGIYSSVIVLLAGLLFLYLAIKLFQKCSKKAALWMMLGSFVYLPLVQIALVVDKLLML